MPRPRRMVARRWSGGALWATVLVGRTAGGAAPQLDVLLQPGISLNSTVGADQGGVQSRTTASEIIGDYRLSLNHELFPLLRYSAGASLRDRLSFLDQGGTSERQEERTSTVFGSLTLGSPLLQGGASFNRRDAVTVVAGVTQHLVSENLALNARWAPTGLPALSVRYAWTANYDVEGVLADLASHEVQASVVYTTIRQLDLRYTVGYARQASDLTATDTATTSHAARGTYRDTAWGQRLSWSVDYGLTGRSAQTTTHGQTGTVATPVYPVAGLALVEAFPAEPTRDALNLNPWLIDADLTTSAHVNLGYSVRVTGDAAPRDLGAMFADATAEVNTIYVWVDKQLPLAVSSQLTWTAYASDNNLTWTPIPVVAPVVFGAFQNRFEITIQATKVKYLKVVTAPLTLTATVDPAFASIYVTELQFLRVVPASGSSPVDSSLRSVVSASARTKLNRSGSVAHDLTLFLTRQHLPFGRTTYFVSNGLSFDRKLPVVAVLARAARDDSDEGLGHAGTWRASGTATATPLPTLRHALTYSGMWREQGGVATNQNAVALFNHVQPYQGIALLGGVSYGFGRNASGQDTGDLVARAALAVQPHRSVSFSSSYVHTRSNQTGGTVPEVHASGDFVEASVSFTPVPAVAVAASVVHTRRTATPARTLVSVSGNLSPFPDGDLRLNFAYAESVDPGFSGVSRRVGPSLRWNVRPRVFLDSAYTYLASEAPLGWSRSSVFFTTLTVAL